MPPDDIRGYDVRTGKHLWTFHVVPRKGEFGNETWLNDSWTYSGNSGVWSLHERATRSSATSTCRSRTATGDYYGGTRPGNNLFAESIMCLDARTGKRVWHYQIVHHGLWDYDLPAAPVLADITVNGRRIKALAQVTKQAFVFVLDRTNGQPVWPIEERPVPQGNVPGEWYSPTQPIPDQAAGVRSAGRLGQRPHRLHAGAEGRSAEDRQRLQATGRCYTPPVLLGRSRSGPRGTIFVPGTNGGGNWGGAAFDKETGILYVPVGAPARHPRARQVAASRVDAAVRQAGRAPASRPAGPARSVQAAVLAAGRHRSEQGRHPVVGRQRRRPARTIRRSRGCERAARSERRAASPRSSPRRSCSWAKAATPASASPARRRRQDVPRVRQEDRARSSGRWSCPAGASNSPMTYMANGKQYIVDRRVRPPVSRRAHRACRLPRDERARSGAAFRSARAG